ncbi:Aste57867_11331 [Aphanomyces stellatus]|uniref:Aste57867_11331 protein n=1 Tax=Aphanomyces stellatus TaxID=120398 RepID=A0A485KSR5_9STRA|nr:hypothetical protein As57867_011289 [Aphanomyces stellatus]VFT88193.1 Aste57867_11331 [Aphanomyces stellatus]
MGNAIQKGKSAIAFEPEMEAPTDGALGALYASATDLVSLNKATLVKMEEYRGCQDQIRKSMSSPTNESYRRDSLSQLIPNVELIQEFYHVAAKQSTVNVKDTGTPSSCQYVGIVFHQLVSTLAKEGSDAHPELFRRLADILVFCLLFDNLKTMNPSIQNDLSYYRRYIAANKDNQSELVPESTANHLSFFVADHMPMLKAVIRTLQDDHDQTHTRVVAQLANLSCAYVAHRKDVDATTELFCLRAMTAAIVVYDHSTAKGVFRANKSDVKMKRCLKALLLAKTMSNNPPAAADQLLDCIRYLTCHFNDDKTPSQIRAMFQ